MAVKVISGIPKSKPVKKPASEPKAQIYLPRDDAKLLDECVEAAQTDRQTLVRRLIRLAHRDLLLWREIAERKAIEPSNGHEVSEEAK